MIIGKIISLLDNLDDVHKQLLQIGEEKKNILIHNRVSELTDIMQKEAGLLDRVADYEKQWHEMASAFFKQKGLEPEEKIVMSDLIKLVFGQEEKQALQNARQQLAQTVEQLQTLNKLNQQLIEQSLAFIDFSLNMLTSTPEDGMVYEKPSSSSSKTRRKGSFDIQA